jgi:hypothetical protein
VRRDRCATCWRVRAILALLESDLELLTVALRASPGRPQAPEPEPVFVITQSLTLIGLLIVGGAIEFDYGPLPRIGHALLDATLVVAPLLLVLWLRGSLYGWIGRKADRQRRHIWTPPPGQA